MLNKEQHYDFRKRMLEVHKKNIRNFDISPLSDEFEIKDGMKLVMDNNASDVIITAVKDFADYLYTSMKISVFVEKGTLSDADIFVATKNEINLSLENADSYKGFRVDVNDKIIVCGFDDRGAAQGLYFLEDHMSEKHAPYITKKTTFRKPLFAPRMVHSGYGLDMFPDEHLAAIAHSGRDAILLFTEDVNKTTLGFLDFNELISRASKYGLDVYAYSYMRTDMHPEDKGAEEVYDNLFGRLFKECPGLKGMVFVGESVEFASKDPRVCKVGGEDNSNDVPTGKPRPGWFPCYDFPQWISLVRDSIRKYKSDAEIVFWTYNWGWAPKKERLELIENLPTDITLHVTYEMFQKYSLENITEYCSDYTLAFEGPGEYFLSEAEAAKKRGIKLSSMTNTGGLTWDMGTIPYQPMPYQWIKRYNGLLEANKKYGLEGLMECHHYGFYPSFIGDLSNLALSDTEMDMAQTLSFVLSKYFGRENVEMLDEALKYWSDSITHITPSDEDQYGPFRVGPSYPLCLKRIVNVPAWPESFAGNSFCFPNYPDFPSNNQPQYTVGTLRIPVEVRSLEKAAKLMKKGIKILEEIKNPNDELLNLINLGKYILCYTLTGLNVKKWYLTKIKLLTEQNQDKVDNIFDELTKIATEEIENAENALSLLDLDSRLGWEPSMGYIGGRENVEWKIRQVKYVIDTEIPKYKESFKI